MNSSNSFFTQSHPKVVYPPPEVMMAANIGSPTPTPGEKQKFNWQRPRLSRNGTSGHKVSFSDSSKRSRGNESSSQSGSSRPSTPPPNSPMIKPALKANRVSPNTNGQSSESTAWQKIDRRGEAVWQEPSSHLITSPTSENPRPFLIYSDSFLDILGPQPTVQLLIQDTRAPYFQNGSIYVSKTNTLFMTSAPIEDPSPEAAPSRNLHITISKVEFFSSNDFSRDKVRTPDHTYMPCSGCVYNAGIVFCAQGTFSEPAALVYMDAKRPHRTYPLLTNFYGTSLNSPHTCIAHTDGSLWFSDPHILRTPSFRPKPQLPAMIYRFDPQTSDLRAMTAEIANPTAIAFSPNYRALYVIDDASKSAISTARSMIYAFTISQPSPFLTNRRLFALPSSRPRAMAIDIFGNVYVACADGVHVFSDGGSLIGRVLVEGGVTGLCFGRGGELWACGRERVWRVQLDSGTKGAVLRV